MKYLSLILMLAVATTASAQKSVNTNGAQTVWGVKTFKDNLSVSGATVTASNFVGAGYGLTTIPANKFYDPWNLPAARQQFIAPFIATNVSALSNYEAFGYISKSPISPRIRMAARLSAIHLTMPSAIAERYTDDNGQSWSSWSIITNEANMDSRNISYGYAKDGSRFMVRTRWSYASARWEGCEVMVSSNETAAWIPIATYTTNLGMTVISAHGTFRDTGQELVHGMYQWDKLIGGSTSVIFCVTSPDGGYSWTNHYIYGTNSTDLGEPTILPVTSNIFFVAIRKTDVAGGALTLWSTNAGRSWFSATEVLTNAFGNNPMGMELEHTPQGDKIVTVTATRTGTGGSAYMAANLVSVILTNQANLMKYAVKLPFQIHVGTEDDGGYLSHVSLGGGQYLVSYFHSETFHTNATMRVARVSVPFVEDGPLWLSKWLTITPAAYAENKFGAGMFPSTTREFTFQGDANGFAWNKDDGTLRLATLTTNGAFSVSSGISIKTNDWPPTFVSVGALSTNYAFMAPSNSVPYAMWFGTFDAESNVVFTGHVP